MTLTVIGPGYVGIPTSTLFASFGNHVFLLGKIQEQIAALRRGDVYLHEPGLADAYRVQFDAGRIIPTLDYEEAIPLSDIVFIAVGTPSGHYGEADLQYVFSAAKELAPHLRGYTVIVTKSTVPVGTADRLRAIIAEHITDAEATFDVASCPEFLREGTALADARSPDRIVIGTMSNRARDILLALHAPLPGGRVTTDPRSAELIKYASNAFLATKISFINEIANICDEVGADVTEVAKGIGMDSRIGPKFLQAGAGWSGSCFPKDVRALQYLALTNKYDSKLLKAAIDVNNDQRVRIVQKIENAVGSLAGKTIGILGLAFKPHTDDIRESAAIDIAHLLLQRGATVRVHDPVARPDDRPLFARVAFFEDSVTMIEGTDALLIATDWPEFLELPWEKLRALVITPIIIDGRNLLDPSVLRIAGWRYIGVGRSAHVYG